MYEPVAKPGHAGRVTLPISQNTANVAHNGRGERPARPQLLPKSQNTANVAHNDRDERPARLQLRGFATGSSSNNGGGYIVQKLPFCVDLALWENAVWCISSALHVHACLTQLRAG
jgi:hypothetical protein